MARGSLVHKSPRSWQSRAVVCLLALVRDIAGDRINGRPARGIVLVDLGKNTIAAVDVIQVCVRAEIDEELGVTVVWDVEVGDCNRSSCI